MPAVSRLSVNVNAIAMLRNRRDLPWPSVTGLAAIAMEAGAKGITVHPRPDERHIRKTDVFELSELIEDRFPNKELCLEGYPAPDFMKLVEEARPEQVLFVPDDPQQSTSDHGWDFSKDTGALENGDCRRQGVGGHGLALLRSGPGGSRTRCQARGGTYRDLHRPLWCLLRRSGTRRKGTRHDCRHAEAAQACGLGVNAGHDLTVENIPALMARAPSFGKCRSATLYRRCTDPCFAESVARFRRPWARSDERHFGEAGRVSSGNRQAEGSRPAEPAHGWRPARDHGRALLARDPADADACRARPAGTDINHVVKLLAVHDLVEIDAGDHWVTDDNRAGIKDLEQAAANRLFALLPSSQGLDFKLFGWSSKPTKHRKPNSPTRWTRCIRWCWSLHPAWTIRPMNPFPPKR